jgi:diguanylate cyclase (GGDEF)-like protein
VPIITSMRRLSLLALLVGIALVPIAYGLAANEHATRAGDLRRQLVNEAGAHAADIDAYFARARSMTLLTVNQPAFRRFDEQPGDRLAKIRAGGRNISDATAALRYLERLYPTSIGEACFIGRTGAERTRVVRNDVAGVVNLSRAERASPFFHPTFALRAGQVYQAPPYVSPDTGEWVVANATPTPSSVGAKRSIVHFEVTIESFRRELRARDRAVELRIVDAQTGRVVVQGDHEQLLAKPLGVPGDHRFAALTRTAKAAGIVDVDGHATAYRRVRRADGNANDWLIVASAAGVTTSLGSDLGVAPIGMLLVALLLGIVGGVGLRAQRRELTSAAETDVLTGLANRRRLMDDLERRIARGAAEPAVLVLFDLNGFKGYNDTFGHLAGDALLRRLGHGLADAVAGSGSAYRLGGDEFCVLAAATDREAVERLSAAALSERGDGFDVTAASGSVLIPDEATAAPDALRLADQRMYASKNGGRPGPDRQSTDVLVRALAERHPDLGDHLDGVAELAESVARELGMTEAEVGQVRHAAELHDVGKVAIPDSIICKPGPLDDDEWAFMRRHTIIGERILGGAPALAAAGRLVRASHERFDGGGYPDGLAGCDIPLGARIIAVCDSFDAMLADRPYSRPRSADEALAELRRCAGGQFDPVVVDAFAAVVAERRDPLAV